MHGLCATGGDQVHLIHAEREAVDVDESVRVHECTCGMCTCVRVYMRNKRR